MLSSCFCTWIGLYFLPIVIQVRVFEASPDYRDTNALVPAFIITCTDTVAYFKPQALAENFYEPIYSSELFEGFTLMGVIYKAIRVPTQQSADCPYWNTPLIGCFSNNMSWNHSRKNVQSNWQLENWDVKEHLCKQLSCTVLTDLESDMTIVTVITTIIIHYMLTLYASPSQILNLSSLKQFYLCYAKCL